MPHGSIFAWHWAQPGWLRCRSSRSRSGSCFVSSLSAGTFGGGSSGGSAMILRASQAPRFTGFDSRPSDNPARIAACGEDAAELAPPVRDRHELEAALDAVGEIVIAGDDLVRHDEVRLDQVSHRQVVADQVLRGTAPALAAVACGVARELGEALAIRFEDLRTCRAPATARRTRPRIVRTAGRRSSASTSSSSRFVQRAGSRPASASSRSGGPFQRKYDSFDASSYSSSGSACGSACCSRSGTGTAATSAPPAARPSRCPGNSPPPCTASRTRPPARSLPGR